MSLQSNAQRKIKRAACAMLVTTCLIGTAHARRSGTDFDGTFDNWSADGDNPVVSGTHTSSLTWGDGTTPSSVSYFEYNVDTGLVLSGRPFTLGRIEYHNGTITLGTGISGATLFLQPSSDDPDLDVSSAIPLQMITESTLNTSDAESSADYLFFSSFVHDPFVPAFFNVYEGSDASADVLATLAFVPDLAPGLAGGQGKAGHYAVNILGFANVQGGGYLSFTPIPEPSSVCCALAGGAGFVRRRRTTSRSRARHGR